MWRIKLLTLGFLISSLILVARLFFWQVVNSEQLSMLAQDQQQSQTALVAHRGSILAADGFPLATSAQSWLLWSSLKEVKDIKKAARVLAPRVVDPLSTEEARSSSDSSGQANLVQILEDKVSQEEERIEQLLSRTDVVWVAVKHNLTRSVKEDIEKLKLPGFGFDLEEDRGYPEASMAAQVLGFVGKDTAGGEKGYFGLEGFYDLTLTGSKGVKSWEKDAFGNPIILGSSHKVGAQDGINLKTHLDRAAQFIVEKHLKLGVQKYEAHAGSVVVMRPKDGAILAMAGSPAYDPAKFNTADFSLYTNPVIGESFEPGSIFKVLVMAAALDAGSVKPEDKCDDCDGPRIIADFSIESGSKQYYPDSTPPEIIQHSDNVGMIWVAERLGQEKLYDYLEDYGLGQATDIDLQGETVPRLREKDKWGLIDLATASFGQGVAVTPIQMVKAVGALASGGRVMAPQIVDKIIGQGWEEDIKPQETARVISPKAAKLITEMMVAGVETKSDMWPIPRGFKVAGKTGTAQVPVSGHYDPDKVVSSFVGFAPAYDPKFVMIVSLRDPKIGQFASQNAAYLWFNIAGDLLPHLGAQPN